MSIDSALLKCAEILQRELTPQETLIVGIAYNMGFGAGHKKKN
jgi:hypothetical protein